MVESGMSVDVCVWTTYARLSSPASYLVQSTPGDCVDTCWCGKCFGMDSSSWGRPWAVGAQRRSAYERPLNTAIQCNVIYVRYAA